MFAPCYISTLCHVLSIMGILIYGLSYCLSPFFQGALAELINLPVFITVELDIS